MNSLTELKKRIEKEQDFLYEEKCKIYRENTKKKDLIERRDWLCRVYYKEGMIDGMKKIYGIIKQIENYQNQPKSNELVDETIDDVKLKAYNELSKFYLWMGEKHNEEFNKLMCEYDPQFKILYEKDLKKAGEIDKVKQKVGSGLSEHPTGDTKQTGTNSVNPKGYPETQYVVADTHHTSPADYDCRSKLLKCPKCTTVFYTLSQNKLLICPICNEKVKVIKDLKKAGEIDKVKQKVGSGLSEHPTGDTKQTGTNSVNPKGYPETQYVVADTHHTSPANIYINGSVRTCLNCGHTWTWSGSETSFVICRKCNPEKTTLDGKEIEIELSKKSKKILKDIKNKYKLGDFKRLKEARK